MFIKVFLSAFLAALTALTSFGLNISIARVSGVDFFANFSFIISLSTIISVFAALGLNQFLLLRAPVQSKNELKEDISKVFNTLFIIFIPFTIGITIFLYLRGDDALTIIAVVAISFALTLLLMFQSIYISLKKIHSYQIYDKVIRNIFIILFIFLSSYYISSYSFSYFIIFVSFSYFLSLLILFLKLKGIVCINLKAGRLKFNQVREFTPLYLVFISVTLIGNLDIIILEYLSDNQGVAIFSASQKVALLAGFIVNAIANVLLPYFVKSDHNGDKDSMDKKIRVSTNLGFYSILIFLLVCYLFGDLLLGVFGDIYTAGYNLLLALVVNSLISAMYGQTLTLMKVKKEGKLLARYIIISLSIKLLCIPILFEYYGVLGVVFSSVICTVIWNHASYLYLKRKHGVDTFIFKWKFS